MEALKIEKKRKDSAITYAKAKYVKKKSGSRHNKLPNHGNSNKKGNHRLAFFFSGKKEK